MPTGPTPPTTKPDSAIARAILDFLSKIPSTDEHEAADPLSRARSIASNAALKASIVSGSLALPPGPAGIVTILPDLVTVWLAVNDFAALIITLIEFELLVEVFGRERQLGRRQARLLDRRDVVGTVEDRAVRVGAHLHRAAGLALVAERVHVADDRVGDLVAGCFEDRDRAATLLQVEVGDRPGPLGCPPRRVFVARLVPPRRLSEFAPALAGLATPSDAFPVEELVLYRSHLSPRGATYEPLVRVPLASG